MLEFLQKEMYLKKLRKMSPEELIKEYINIRSKGSILCSVGSTKHKDIQNWITCEDYLTKTKKVDFQLLDDYAIICNSLSSVKTEEKMKEELRKSKDLAMKKLLEVL